MSCAVRIANLQIIQLRTVFAELQFYWLIMLWQSRYIYLYNKNLAYIHYISTCWGLESFSIAVAILARGHRVARPPLSHSRKKFNTYFAFIFFTYSRKYLCVCIAKCQSVVCVILFSNATAL